MLAAGVPHAVEALLELVKFGKDRERLAAAKELLSWAIAPDAEDDVIQLCAVSPEVIGLEDIRAEAERRRQLAMRAPVSAKVEVVPDDREGDEAIARARAVLRRLGGEER